ncbi:TPA: PTS sugar transporter subunit IIB [Enterococcus faecalis]|uniref:PTS sugar transporter subunit IIB n=1 Tax=Enterococcus TaxID=1350 RepID=UPI00032FC799|nr:PTS sugar transporter subunit IIB [Enterococcus faecalis]EGO2593386.1 PTS sugar transporter subunit IIB [Enterococcus faecalis]EGO2677223.1 PTS sugar transporter subunit IIB [Enterococcus faecalis]EGO2690876.1 PTS sugar transporter subunit IIB [Enterococcus faecalis]EGO2721473.1 PTS sugar transporter subunit IIB [Enterococcus faecalis]EGO2752572.1 PTS sugar transporter subunit IIB [Enterococcus faecalis]
MSKKIMLACAAGMSTSLLVTKMQKAAEAKQLDVEIFAVPVSDSIQYAEEKNVDVVLLGPQVRYMLHQFKLDLEPKSIPVDVIPMTDYGMMDGGKVLMLAENLINRREC